MKTSKKKEASSLLWLLIIYKITLDMVFLGVIVDIYDYYGFTGSFSWTYFIISWIMFVVFSKYLLNVLSINLKNLSSIAIFTLYIISFVPFSSMVNYGVDPAFYICNYIFWTALIVFEWFYLKRSVRREIIENSKPQVVFTGKIIIFSILTVFACGIILYISGRYTGFRFNLSLNNVYVLRLDAAENTLGFMGYFFGWANAIILIALSFSILKKKYFVSILLFAIQILNFSYNGMKTTLFLTLAVVAFAFLLRFIKLKSILTMLLSLFIIINILSLFEYYAIGSWQLINLFSFRTFLLPVKISEWFFDFFSTHEPDFFRTGFVGRITGLESPYSEYGIDYLISGIYFGNYHSRANNGLISDAMTNLGYPGLVIMPFLIASFFHLCDKCSRGLPKEIVLSVVLFFSVYLTNVFFTTFLITDSGLLMCLLMYLLPRNKPKAVANRENKQVQQDNVLVYGRTDTI